jgi:uncharacterized membrane protein
MKVFRIILAILALCGMAAMTYLTYLHFSPVEGSFCNLGEGLSCDIVNKSIYSKIFGIPMSVLGLLYFCGVLAVALFRYDEKTLKLALFGTIAFLGPSVYLTIIELTVLENICIFCEFSKVMMLGIVGTLIAAVGRREKAGFYASAVILAGLSGGITYWSHARIIPSGTYNNFAMCLTNSGFKMYGSKGCSFCAQQRQMFGDAFENVIEIECDPRFPNPQVERCVALNIEHTPTWIQEDSQGNVLHKFDAGVVSLQKLSERSGCMLPE